MNLRPAARLQSVIAFLVTACGGTSSSHDAPLPDAGPLDAGAPDASPPDARFVGPPDAALMVRVTGHVDYNGPLLDATVTLLEPLPQQGTSTNASGDFFFDVPKGSRVVIKVERVSLLPMIRSYIADENRRISTYYLAGAPDEDAAKSLGLSFDPAKAIIEVDFRNSAIGGYGATITDGAGGTVQPGFGYAYDADGNPVKSLLTVTGGDGSTMLYGNVPPGSVSFTPVVPGQATLPCTPCDSDPLPLQAGVVTWFDFECGTATDCL